jgi:ABC-type dipeptide/oligopeptide/nickel transport system permease subunit
LLRAHVLPNLTPLLSTSFALIFVWAVKAEAVLGYLGLSAVEWPSWGRIMADGGSELARGIWWPVVGAALPLALLVLSVQVLADRLSDDDAG